MIFIIFMSSDFRYHYKSLIHFKKHTTSTRITLIHPIILYNKGIRLANGFSYYHLELRSASDIMIAYRHEQKNNHILVSFNPRPGDHLFPLAL